MAGTPQADGGPVLVGRDREQAEIARLLDGTLVAGAQTLLVEGEAGIGKTALATATVAAARSRGMRVVAARADELAGRRSLGLITDALGGLGMADWRRAAAAYAGRDSTDPLALGGALGADAEFAASEAAIDALDGLCAAGPVALVLEDLHWADRSSLYVLRRLVRHTGDLPLVLLGTMRPLPRPPELAALLADLGQDRRLHLRGLEADSVERLLAGAVGGSPGPHLRAQAATAGGNPLFLLEMIDALRAERALHPVRGGAEVDIDGASPPPSLRLTVLHRLSFLAADTLHVLSLAAVLGARFRPGHLAALANRSIGELVAPLRAALAAGLLTDVDGELAFRHELVRDALYGDLPQGLRSDLHREAARVLARAGAPAGVVAEHLLRGAEPGDDEAVVELQLLARQMADSMPVTAVELLERAAALAGPRSPRAPDLLADLAVALLWSGRAEEGEAACHRALARLADSAQRVPLRQCLVESLLHRGKAAAMLPEVEACLQEAALDVRTRARMEGLAANARLFLGQLEVAQVEADGAEAAGRVVGDVAAIVRAHVVQALLAEASGHSAAAAEIAGRAVAMAGDDRSRAVHEAQPHLTQAMFLIDAGSFAEANRLLAHGLQAHEALGARAMIPIHHVCLGFSHFWAGRWEQAVAEIETAVALAEETGTGWRTAARGLRAAVAVARGDLDTAERWLAAAEAELAAGEAPYRVAWLHWARALWLEACGREADPEPMARPEGGLITLATVGPTAVRLALAGNRPELAASVTSALSALANMNPQFPGIAAALATAQGLLAGEPQALAEAVDAYRRAGRPVEQALAADAGAAAAARSGRRAEAGELLDQAIRGYQALDAPHWVAQAQRRLSRRAPARVPPRPVHGWTSLTATEQRVLRLVAERRTNPEIAAALEMSRRTVETHITHILAKVGLRSRLQLADAAARRFGWELRLRRAVEEGERAQ